MINTVGELRDLLNGVRDPDARIRLAVVGGDFRLYGSCRRPGCFRPK